MKEILLEQCSQEWLEFRKEHIGCSEVAAIMDLNPYKSPYKVWLEKCNYIEKEEPNDAMKRGLLLESKARDKYIELTGVPMIPKIYTCDQWDILEASLDGISLSDHEHILEIKIPSNSKLYDLAKNEDKLPEYYMLQVQAQLLVTNAKKCDFFVYLTEVEYCTITVYPDKTMQKEILKKCKEFWNMVLIKNPPKRREEDPLFLNTDRINLLATEYKAIKLKIKNEEEKLEKLEIELKDFVKDEKHVIFGNSGVQATSYTPKGTVNWVKLAGDFNISEEVQDSYRKESNKIIRFKI